ncbi:Serine/threonine-protein_phosphatase 2A [Hexamita inflata]|uniref:Serine/threonine-protein_phosphatase 2A n=1 Tax=Hexamita inflata TaxID=28002 RepID=A0ABP1I8U2_9EUKA
MFNKVKLQIILNFRTLILKWELKLRNLNSKFINILVISNRVIPSSGQVSRLVVQKLNDAQIILNLQNIKITIAWLLIVTILKINNTQQRSTLYIQYILFRSNRCLQIQIASTSQSYILHQKSNRNTHTTKRKNHFNIDIINKLLLIYQTYIIFIIFISSRHQLTYNTDVLTNQPSYTPGPEYDEAIAASAFAKLLQDSEAEVRCVACQRAIRVANRLSPASIQQYIIPQLDERAGADDSQFVCVTLAKQLEDKDAEVRFTLLNGTQQVMQQVGIQPYGEKLTHSILVLR